MTLLRQGPGKAVRGFPSETGKEWKWQHHGITFGNGKSSGIVAGQAANQKDIDWSWGGVSPRGDLGPRSEGGWGGDQATGGRPVWWSRGGVGGGG